MPETHVLRTRLGRSVPLIALVIAVATCKSSGSPATPGTGSTGTSGGPANGSMSANINGVRWDAVVITTSIMGGVLRIGGQDSRTMPFIGLGIAGTFSFALVHFVTASTGTKTITNGAFNVTF